MENFRYSIKSSIYFPVGTEKWQLSDKLGTQNVGISHSNAQYCDSSHLEKHKGDFIHTCSPSQLQRPGTTLGKSLNRWSKDGLHKFPFLQNKHTDYTPQPPLQ